MKQEIIEIYNSNKNYYKKHLTLTHLEFLKSKFNWTNNLKEQIYKNNLKAVATKALGYNYKLEVKTK